MTIRKNSEVISIFLCMAVCIGIISSLVTFTQNGEISRDCLVGLLLGSLSGIFNFFMLELMIKFLVSGNPLLAVPIYLLRVIIYILAAFGSVAYGMASTITFSTSIIAISASIFIVYGIIELRGTRSDDQR